MMIIIILTQLSRENICIHIFFRYNFFHHFILLFCQAFLYIPYSSCNSWNKSETSYIIRFFECVKPSKKIERSRKLFNFNSCEYFISQWYGIHCGNIPILFHTLIHSKTHSHTLILIVSSKQTEILFRTTTHLDCGLCWRRWRRRKVRICQEERERRRWRRWNIYLFFSCCVILWEMLMIWPAYYYIKPWTTTRTIITITSHTETRTFFMHAFFFFLSLFLVLSVSLFLSLTKSTLYYAHTKKWTNPTFIHGTA